MLTVVNSVNHFCLRMLLLDPTDCTKELQFLSEKLIYTYSVASAYSD